MTPGEVSEMASVERSAAERSDRVGRRDAVTLARAMPRTPTLGSIILSALLACSSDSPASSGPELQCGSSSVHAFCGCNSTSKPPDDGNTTSCSAAAVGQESLCCALERASERDCYCQAYRCVDGDTSGCRCGLVTTEHGAKEVPSCQAASGKVCCASSDRCYCGADPGTCNAGDQEVGTCAAASLEKKCPEDRTQTDVCK